MKNYASLMLIPCMLFLQLDSALACVPSEIRNSETSIDVAEGRVVARYGRIGGVPVPLIVAQVTSMFDIGDGVATVFVDRVVNGDVPKIITVTQKLEWSSFRCVGDMPGYDRVVLLSGGDRLGKEFNSFFGPSGFVVGTYAALISREKAQKENRF